MQKKSKQNPIEKLNNAIADRQKLEKSLEGIKAHQSQLIATGNEAEEKLGLLEEALNKIPDERKEILSNGANIEQLKALNIKQNELQAEIQSYHDISDYNLNHSDLDENINRGLKNDINTANERIYGAIHDEVEIDVKNIMPVLLQAFSFRCLSSDFTMFQAKNNMPNGYGRDGFGEYMAKHFNDYISQEFGPNVDDINNVGPRSFTVPFLKSDTRFKDLDIH